METESREATAAGVMVEFRDACGHTVGQAVYFDWCGAPLPEVGDTLCCDARRVAARRRQKLQGRVCSRQFDVQHDEAGQPCVWVLLVVETNDRAASRDKSPSRAITFSLN